MMLARYSPLTRSLAVISLTCWSSLTSALAANNGAIPLPDVAKIASGIRKNDQFKQANLQDFTVIRHYVLKNSRMSVPAELTVRLRFQRGVGKSYEIVSPTTASGMCRKVLDRILTAEVEAAKPNTREESRFTPENYQFELLGAENCGGRRCYVLQLHPRKRSRFLIQGKAWVDAEHFALLKVEGHPSANLSFWVGKPLVTQEFQKYGDFWMSSHNRSLSESYMLGKSELTIEYSQYEVNTRVTQTAALHAQGSLE